VRTRRAALSKVRAGERLVELDDGTSLEYDYLVLASGVTTNWIDVKGAEENALPIYSVGDAVRLRRRLQRVLEETATGRRESAHVVVVGGGATGVEMAGSPNCAAVRSR
jgi:NADH dehydrogenase